MANEYFIFSKTKSLSEDSILECFNKINKDQFNGVLNIELHDNGSYLLINVIHPLVKDFDEAASFYIERRDYTEYHEDGTETQYPAPWLVLRHPHGHPINNYLGFNILHTIYGMFPDVYLEGESYYDRDYERWPLEIEWDYDIWVNKFPFRKALVKMYS